MRRYGSPNRYKIRALKPTIHNTSMHSDFKFIIQNTRDAIVV